MKSVKETSRRLVWTGELPDHVVDLQADDFHDEGTRLQDTRLRIRDKHVLIICPLAADKNPFLAVLYLCGI